MNSLCSPLIFSSFCLLSPKWGSHQSIYHFFPHFIRVSIKYNQNEFDYENPNKKIENLSYPDIILTRVQ